MKRFVFGLERLLHLRVRTEREQAQALGIALREEEERRRQLDAADSRLQHCAGQIGSSAAVPAGMLRNLGLTVEAAAWQVEATRQAHDQSQEALAQEQLRYGHARVERRTLERLREQREETWHREATRDEQQTMDEVSRHFRRRPEIEP